MTSEVFYVNITNKEESIKIQELINKLDFTKKVQENDKVAIKTPIYDIENKGHMEERYLQEILKVLKNTKPFIYDTKTINSTNKSNDLYKNTNIEIKTSSDKQNEIKINQTIFDKIKIDQILDESDFLIVISIFKAHHIAGLGGAIKNLGLDCAPYNEKINHYKQAAPFISKIGCLACKVCIEECPQNAISLNSIAVIDYDKCIGCNKCVEICPKDTIMINRIKSDEFNQAICEYAYGINENKKDKILFINFLTDIRVDNESNTPSNKKIVNDIGILASYDPVALDKASYDLINKQEANKDSDLKSNYKEGENKIKGLWRTIDPEIQLKKAENLNIGSQDYKLIKI